MKNDLNQPTSIGRARRTDSIRNRQRVLNAAIALFNRKGITVPLEEIASEAQVGIGTVYRNFPNKRALFEAVIQETMTELIRSAKTLAAQQDPGTALLDFMLLMGRSAKLKHSLIQALSLTENSASAALQQTLQAFNMGFGQLVVNGQKAGTVRSDVTVADIRALLAGCILAEGNQHATTTTEKRIRIIYTGICVHRSN
ncbi:MAG TPA: TetR/AcrR family transcriptional regulator [Candidatus Saccharimonadales bacterium]|nr:TetR/AcrR family transcriptional regulator [Candidatus Saccharimonadales bacterium]